ncbi:ATP-binding protein [Streptomyces sp. ME19-01-6]|uniref:ATP-binding protein n=1 Tax=Streptomyces sp. ME19-01-6 TaxID=3028686 RepID=UPI0029B73E76|nr:BTAD domain-containing putative transcriptional regulator [Streptomyces sp. ME19-01-6]MDX3226814.1 BTAD domain-containing putative transcriptional regulator [Streptomyces sp. ME19-01-6]
MTTELTLLTRVSCRGRAINGPRLRGLLALLAGEPRTGCGTARLVDGLWPEDRPENPTKALQILVSRARSQLGADVIASTPTGYRLALPEDQVDSSAVLLSAAASARHARVGDHAAALAHAEAGLALWEGAPGGEAGGAAQGAAAGDPVAALRAERATTYRTLARARALSLSRLGRRAEAAEPLADLARERPRDEEVLLELLRCEAATLGPSAALARYDTYRRALRDELGTDPGPALQAVHEELLRGEAPVVRHGIPYEPNPLLGRDEDIAAVAGLLDASRVASVVGPGGLGKTRLAHAVSRRAGQRAVYFVGLAGVTSEDDVVREVASALGVGEAPHASVGHLGLPTDVLSGILAALGSGPVLLVLDNCEHVIRGAAELVRHLVSSTRDLRVLTTSRAPLGLSSEAVYLLPELSLATTVELFEQRARAVRPGADLPAGAVEELCRHLDGLPLAVELAAARVRVMAVAEIARRLEDRFTLLRGGARDAPSRHRTLHAVVDWSWNLLDAAGQAALRALSVFPGGFTADAVLHLLDDDGDAIEVLADLADQSLLKVADTPSGARFRMLETVREFSTAHREAAGETDRVIGRFLAWSRDFGTAHHEKPHTPDPFAAIDRIRAEQDNLVHALRHGLARDDGASVAATAAVLASLWTVEGNYTRVATLAAETSRLLSHFRPERGSDPALVEVTRTATALFTANTFTVIGLHAGRPLATLRRLPPAPPDTLARAVATVLAAAPEVLGPDPAPLRALCDSDEPLLAGVANAVASYVLERAGDVDGALRAARGMLDAFRGRSPGWVLVLAHSRIGELCLQAERGEEGRRNGEEALRLLEESVPWGDASGLRAALTLVNLQLGAVDEAERWLPLTTPDREEETVGVLIFDFGMRAELLLARGDAEAGCRQWRRAVEASESDENALYRTDPPGLEPWTLEVEAAAVVAHAHHGRLDLIEKTVGRLPHKLWTMLSHPVEKPPAYLMDLPVCGALLLALARVELDRAERTGDEGARTSGARLIALAERFRFLRGFQPTMSSARARHAAEQADRAAYADAVSSYAALGPDELRATALTAIAPLTAARREYGGHGGHRRGA